MWPSHTVHNPYREPGHVGSWGSCKVGLQEAVRQSHAAVLWYPSGPGCPWSGCTHPVGSQGRTEGRCHLLWKERALSSSCSRAPRCLSGIDVPQCHVDGHKLLVKTEGWVASSPPTSPLGSWGGIKGTHLSGGGKSNLYLLLKLCPGGGVLFAPLWLSRRCLPAETTALECCWAGSVFGSYSLGVKGASFASRAIPIWSTKYEICK